VLNIQRNFSEKLIMLLESFRTSRASETVLAAFVSPNIIMQIYLLTCWKSLKSEGIFSAHNEILKWKNIIKNGIKSYFVKLFKYFLYRSCLNYCLNTGPTHATLFFIHMLESSRLVSRLSRKINRPSMTVLVK